MREKWINFRLKDSPSGPFFNPFWDDFTIVGQWELRDVEVIFVGVVK